MLVTVLGMVGELERRFILERQATGIAKQKRTAFTEAVNPASIALR
jgi:DNA invertase Pin-like site-specific DNA recombinase